MNRFDTIVVGSGLAGIIAAIFSAKRGENILLLEQLPRLATKLKATGGGRCNLSNRLSNQEFVSSFSRVQSRFIAPIIEKYDQKSLVKFFDSIGLQTHSPDGFRIFPTTHSSQTVIDSLENILNNLNINIMLECKLKDILVKNDQISSVVTSQGEFYTKKLILATGGLGYSNLGATGESFDILKKLGHNITQTYPAMMPLFTKQTWVQNCTADTLPKVTIKVDIKKLPNSKKLKKLEAKGDLIFTKKGIRGPVVLDFAREITPFLDQYKSVPILINMTKYNNEDMIIKHIKQQVLLNNIYNILDIVKTLLPNSVSNSLLNYLQIDRYYLHFLLKCQEAMPAYHLHQKQEIHLRAN